MAFDGQTEINSLPSNLPITRFLLESILASRKKQRVNFCRREILQPVSSPFGNIESEFEWNLAGRYDDRFEYGIA